MHPSTCYSVTTPETWGPQKRKIAWDSEELQKEDINCAQALMYLAKPWTAYTFVAEQPDRKKVRGKRTTFPYGTVKQMEKYYEEVTTRPIGQDLTDLASRLKEDRNRVRCWFQNKRAKDRMNDEDALIEAVVNEINK